MNMSILWMLYFRYKFSVLALTYLAYMCYHMTRKPISVVKSVLHRNCSMVEMPKNFKLTTDASNESTWCDYPPFGKINVMMSWIISLLRANANSNSTHTWRAQLETNIYSDWIYDGVMVFIYEFWKNQQFCKIFVDCSNFNCKNYELWTTYMYQ